MVGTMIEIPRAALLADEIAEDAEFFSFGTNDLTQMTLGLSRDDAGRFLPDYVMSEKEGGKAIFAQDPFVSLDQSGVGQLVKMGIERGRSTRKGLKVGICGEHGGESRSVKFCHAAGMNYVSCSPFRVPIARLAAAQAVIEAKAARASAAKKATPARKPVPRPRKSRRPRSRLRARARLRSRLRKKPSSGNPSPRRPRSRRRLQGSLWPRPSQSEESEVNRRSPRTERPRGSRRAAFSS